MTKAADRPLTVRQAEVLRAILTHYVEHGVGPTFDELKDSLGIGSKNGVVCNLEPMAEKGVIVITKFRSRSIIIPELDAVIKATAKDLLARHLTTIKGIGKWADRYKSE